MNTKTNKKFWGITVFIITLFFLFLAFFLFKKNQENINVNVLKINDTVFTEKEVQEAVKGVFRDWEREGKISFSEEKAREEAIKKLRRVVVAEEYFNDKGVSLSDEEIESAYNQVVERRVGVNTKEEYFRVMSLEGFSKEELERNIIFEIKYNKRVLSLSESIEISEEDFEDYISLKDYVRAEIKLIDPSFVGDVEEAVLFEEIKKAKAKELVDEEMEELFENTIVVFL